MRRGKFFADILSYDFIAILVSSCNKISKEIRVSNERGGEIVTLHFLVEANIYILLIKSLESMVWRFNRFNNFFLKRN